MADRSYKWKARHTVLSILFATSSVSFMDRMAISIAIPYIAADYQLTPMTMGAVMSIFYIGYSITQIPGGLLADIFGVRKVATIAMLWWSSFTAVTGAAGNLTQMLTARFLFGLGEGMFPACSFKTIAVWFPKKDRATATAILFSSTSIGAALAPLAVVAIISLWGWRAVFFGLSLPGILMSLLFWIFIPDKPSESRLVSPEELAEIEENGSERPEASTATPSFLRLVKEPDILKCFFILLAFDIAIWGFTTWLPTFLVSARGFSMGQMGLAASLPFLTGAFGCVLGGWVSDKLFSNDRRIPIIASHLLCAILLYLTFAETSSRALVLFETLEGFWLMFSLSAVWALPMSIVPKELMGVAGGFINVAGQIAAFLSPLAIGWLVGNDGGSFDHAFLFLVLALIASCGITLTLPGKLSSRRKMEDHKSI